MAKILYHAVPGDWRKEQKYAFLEKSNSVADVKWTRLTPDKRGNWITNDTDEEFEAFLPIGSKDAKAGMSVPTIFRTYSLGVSTNRDAVVYDFDAKRLAKRVEQFYDDYNEQVSRYQKKGRPEDVDNFVDYTRIKWSHFLKEHLKKGHIAKFKKSALKQSLYRPFATQHIYLERPAVDAPGLQYEFYPNDEAFKKNKAICLTGSGSERPFMALLAAGFADLHLCGFGCTTQCFALFTYSEDGKERRDNITPKARTLFQIFYEDDNITQVDVFHYVYAVLHHPAYRTRFAENLKRDHPRIPFVGVAERRSPNRHVGKDSKHADSEIGAPSFFPLSAVEKMQGHATPDHDPKASAKLFHAFAAAGKKLADLHVNYESAKEFKLQRQENKEVKLDWRVEAMKLTKDKSSIIYNDFLTLSGIPPEVFDYKLGNRSALEWVIDQYRVAKDDQGNLTSDPNRMDDEEYIVRLIGQVITVSVETVKIVKSLPELKFD